jgi:hypothetical protein
MINDNFKEPTEIDELKQLHHYADARANALYDVLRHFEKSGEHMTLDQARTIRYEYGKFCDAIDKVHARLHNPAQGDGFEGRDELYKGIARILDEQRTRIQGLLVKIKDQIPEVPET